MHSLSLSLSLSTGALNSLAQVRDRSPSTRHHTRSNDRRPTEEKFSSHKRTTYNNLTNDKKTLRRDSTLNWILIKKKIFCVESRKCRHFFLWENIKEFVDRRFVRCTCSEVSLCQRHPFFLFSNEHRTFFDTFSSLSMKDLGLIRDLSPITNRL